MSGWRVLCGLLLVVVWSLTVWHVANSSHLAAGVALLVAVAGTIMVGVGWDE